MRIFVLILTVMAFSASAQMDKPFNWQIQISGEINASADESWRVLGKEYTQIADWFSVVEVSRATELSEIPEGLLPGVDREQIVGRYTETKFAKATEFLTEYSDTEREFTFEAFGMPKALLKRAKNSTKVSVLSNGRSKVDIEVNMGFRAGFFFLKGPMKKRMTKMFEKLLIELDQHLVIGESTISS